MMGSSSLGGVMSSTQSNAPDNFGTSTVGGSGMQIPGFYDAFAP